MNKNIIDFSGKSLIAWTIETALKSPFIYDIYDTVFCQEKLKTVRLVTGA